MFDSLGLFTRWFVFVFVHYVCLCLFSTCVCVCSLDCVCSTCCLFFFHNLVVDVMRFVMDFVRHIL